jgi:hypothetical protein
MAVFNNDPLHEARKGIAMIARDKWDNASTPHEPFGFAFLDWSVEVHVRLHTTIGPHDLPMPAVKLDCYKVTHTGQLMELVKVTL